MSPHAQMNCETKMARNIRPPETSSPGELMLTFVPLPSITVPAAPQQRAVPAVVMPHVVFPPGVIALQIAPPCTWVGCVFLSVVLFVITPPSPIWPAAS